MNIEYINNNFPNIELSYDKFTHKKVPNLYLAIPYGKKYYLWFTCFNSEDVCYLLEYNNKKNEITGFKKITVFYDKQLSYGTVLYGSVVNYNKQNYFACENIMYYKGKDITNIPFKYKLNKCQDMFLNYINQIAYTNNEYIITLCLMSNDKNKLIQDINNENYNVFGIMSRNIHNNYSFLTPLNNKHQTFKLMTFRVMADIKHNVYLLYIYDNQKGITFHQKTYIPDYNTSVMLNNKFRIIKENSNLDLLEESDDEEEFENINDDKYVYTDKYFNYKCYFHHKIKRWIPKEFTNDTKLVNSKDILNYK